MSRDFTKNVSNYMSLGVDAISALIAGAGAVSVGCWIHADTFSASASGNLLLVAYMDTVAGLLFYVPDVAGTKIVTLSGRSNNTDPLQTVTGVTAVTTGANHHVGAVLDVAGDSIRVYLDGTQDASGSVTFSSATYTPGTPTSADTIGGDGVPPSATTEQHDGRIGELAVWAADITTAGFEQLADGFSPALVRPDALVFYMPLLGRNSPETDVVGGRSGTITGTIAQADHFRVLMPDDPWICDLRGQTPGAGLVESILLGRRRLAVT